MKTINPEDYKKLLLALDFGSSVAESDPLLEEASIETSAFMQLAQDSIDLIRGTKGSGKSSLFIIFSRKGMADFLLEKYNIVIVNGVEPQGDPVFQAFHDNFKQLDEIEFQNFWRIYIISLIDKYVIENSQLDSLKSRCSSEIAEFKEKCRKSRIPQIEQKSKLWDIVGLVLKVCTSLKLVQEVDPKTGAMTTTIQYSPALSSSGTGTSKTPIFLTEIHDSLLKILEKANLNVWVMLDRLDEVFARRAKVEKVALRALLQTTRSFITPRIRIKVFIRDDIIDHITEENGFTGLSHITARASDVLDWSVEDILYLITKRLFLNASISNYYSIDFKGIEKSEAYRKEAFYKIFPPQVETGEKQASTLDWIYSHCQDGKGVVTPRDVIDLLNFARSRQNELFTSQPIEQEFLISSDAIKYGFTRLSERKLDVYLKAEFPHFRSELELLQGTKSEHNKRSLTKIFGGERVDNIIKNFCSIGILLYQPSSDSYKIPFLFRPALKLKQGKAF